MKFSCDSCNAQYMIADEKIGTKGVKVRCKKCAFVIILRPSPEAEEPTPDETRIEAAPRSYSSDEESRDSPVIPSTAPPSSIDQNAFEDEDRTIAMDAGSMPVAPSVAAEAQRNSNSVSGLGVSADFATDGFDEPLSDLALSAQSNLDLGLDVGRVDSEDGVMGSPFGTGVEGGGSLEQVGAMFGGEEDFALEGSGHISDEFSEQQDQTRVEPQWSGALEEEQDQTAEHVEMATKVGQSPFAGDPAAEWSPEGDSVSLSIYADEDDGDGDTSLDSSGIDSMSPMRDAFGEDEPLDGFEPSSDTDDFGDAEDEQLVIAPDFNQTDEPGISDTGEAEISAETFGDDSMGEDFDSEETPEPAIPDNMIEQEESEDSFASEIGAAFDAAIDDGLDGDDPFGAIASRPTDEGHEEPPEVGLETRIYDDDAEKKVEEEWARAKASESSDIIPEPQAEESEWFLAIDDEQVGPLTLTEVREKLSSASISNDTLCWKQGMADWLAVRFVKELSPVIEPQPVDTPSDENVALFGKPEAAQSFLAAPDDPFGDDSFGPSDDAAVTPELAEDDDEMAWQPKGADFLASLVAAEEVDEGPEEAIDRPSDISFLGDDSGRAARARNASALFGANDVSAVNLNRPLPRASQVSGTLGLRDAAPPRASNSNLILPAVVVSVAIVAAAVIFVVFGRSAPEKTPEPNPVALAAKSEQAAKSAGIVSPSPAPAVPTTPKPAAEAAPTDTKPAEKTAPPSTAKAKEPPAPSAKTQKKRTAAKASKKSTASSSGGNKSASSSRRPKTSGSGLPALPIPGAGSTRAKAPERRIPPPPPKKRVANPARFSKDDLLGGAGRGEAPTLPRTLDEAQLLKVILRHKKVIRDCKKKQKVANPSLGGVMQVTLVIKKTGRTSKVKVAPPKFAGSTVGACVAKSVKSWVFPKFTGTSIPLDFPVKVKGSR